MTTIYGLPISLLLTTHLRGLTTIYYQVTFKQPNPNTDTIQVTFQKTTNTKSRHYPHSSLHAHNSNVITNRLYNLNDATQIYQHYKDKGFKNPNKQ